VLEGGFDLWLGDNIAILSMEKQAHLFISNITHMFEDQNLALIPIDKKIKCKRNKNTKNIAICTHKSHEIYLGKP
jgi:hypothetical protein